MTYQDITSAIQTVGAVALVAIGFLQWRVYRQQREIMFGQLEAAVKTVDAANAAITKTQKNDLTGVTMSFYAMWMGDKMYSGRTTAGIFCRSIKQDQSIVYNDLGCINPTAWEQIGRVTHFISEMMASYEADLMDRPLTKSLFGTTLIEWDARLKAINFPDDAWHKEFDRRRKLAVREFGPALT